MPVSTAPVGTNLRSSQRRCCPWIQVLEVWAAGIGILTVILGILLFIGCWYCRRRSGYRSLKDKSLHACTPSTLIGRCSCDGLGRQDSKLPFQENNCEFVVPNAPPAYEKVSAEQSPPPYSP
ncbi:melanoma antigen recognized by T-cells 1 isoform X1 [Rousettus aegyptiacus]|uniref:melanoma antigen recognized by T-cells 1 isoform X1 n=1 Tax=Rousettus aegyptiacus TaxID=9407 RepID=UPI00168D4C4B|nr:melanoma antigen recognized by T-cells 1 isoform X1 [Rousettus aegyptiacus]